MRSITVQPEQLESCAARMDDKNQDYLNGTIELFNAVDTMGNAWKGKDNQAFTTRISKFQSDFRQLSMLCTQYSEFLKNSARAYRQTQDQLISQANKLAQ
jgi:WXG100 family type VII secretion target